MRCGVATEIAEMGEVAARAVLNDSGVTWAELEATAAFIIRILSGVGRDGEVSAEDTDSAPEMKLFISDKAGAKTPGSADVNALTAG